MDCDVVRYDVRIGQDVALLYIYHKRAANGRALNLRLPWLRIVGIRPLHKHCRRKELHVMISSLIARQARTYK